MRKKLALLLSGGVYYVWVPGHWGRHRHHRVWVHGYYIVR
ncbi:MAG: hypothetical protein DMF30_09535 [Verrucomicrobia bacterium]|nr:MAG: hypothetical protein DMF30_09535 [Verrucomicrobiota bacterium]